ncbi:MAG: hypothetical protein EA399_16170, partial [Desulfovibrionales bacterium]
MSCTFFRGYLAVVCAEYGVTNNDLLISRSGDTNEPRNAAIYLLRSLRGDNVRNQHLQQVSSILLRLQSRLQKRKH